MIVRRVPVLEGLVDARTFDHGEVTSQVGHEFWQVADDKILRTLGVKRHAA